MLRADGLHAARLRVSQANSSVNCLDCGLIEDDTSVLYATRAKSDGIERLPGICKSAGNKTGHRMCAVALRVLYRAEVVR